MKKYLLHAYSAASLCLVKYVRNAYQEYFAYEYSNSVRECGVVLKYLFKRSRTVD